MSWLRTIAEEFVGLFVDDGWLAVAIIAWIVLGWIAGHMLAPAGWMAPVFALGLIAIVIDSALRRARG
jgi:hypothetical protein